MLDYSVEEPIGSWGRAITAGKQAYDRQLPLPRQWTLSFRMQEHRLGSHPAVSRSPIGRARFDRLLTLDTCCVISLMDRGDTEDVHEMAALEQIVDLARAGVLRLQVAAAYERDISRKVDRAVRDARLAWLADAPVTPAPGVRRNDVSILDYPDVLGDDADDEFDQKLRALLCPSSLTEPVTPHEEDPKAASKQSSDVDHLTAHRRSGADAFLTTDKGILGKRAALADLGILVCRPTEALRRLSSAHR